MQKTNILLVAPLQEDAHDQNWGAPSLGLMRIDSYLKTKLKNHVEINIYDQQIDDYNLFDYYRNQKVDFLGISVLHYTLVKTLAFINKWKTEHPESIVVVGGNEAGANYQDILDKSPADFIATVEGEEVFYQLLLWKTGKQTLDKIDGIIYRKFAPEITDNTLWDYWKDVDFSKYRYEKYWEKMKRLYDDPPIEKINCVRIVTTSHCSRQCSFCSLYLVRHNACGKKTKPASLRGWQIFELLNRIKTQVPDTKTIYFVTDDIFYPNRKDFYDFIEIYRKSNLNFNILVQTSTFSIKKQDFEVLKSINCKHITIGVENASEKIRTSLNKTQSSEKIEQIVEWSKEYDLPVYYLNILMPPESTIDDLKINYNKLTEWHNKGIGISIEPLIYAYRGAPIFEDPRYEVLYKVKDIPNTTLKYKDSIYVLPKDPIVRKIAIEFKNRETEFIKNEFSKISNKHHFKGQTSIILLKLLKDLIEKYDK